MVTAGQAGRSTWQNLWDVCETLLRYTPKSTTSNHDLIAAAVPRTLWLEDPALRHRAAGWKVWWRTEKGLMGPTVTGVHGQ
eukprot:3800453-Rhodomonas_salina.2